MAWEDALQRYQTAGGYTPPERTPFDRMSGDVREVGWSQGGVERVVWRLFPDGSGIWWEEGWNDGRTDLSVTRRFDPQQLLTFRVFGALSPETWQGFPFDPSDRTRAEEMIRSWDAATVLGLYYNLWTFDPPPCGGCSVIKPVEGFTPRALYDPPRSGYGTPWNSLWQYAILQWIWKLRTDLRSLRDPATGNIVDGLVDPARFPQVPCNVSCSSFDPWINLGLSILTLGVGGIGSATISIVQMANQITRMRDMAAQAAAYRDFAQSIGVGVSAIQSGAVSTLPAAGAGRGFPAALLLLLLLL